MNIQLKRFLIVSWSLAVFYIHLGALINFHQNRIWKKALCPELVASHRDNKHHQQSVLKVKLNPASTQQQFVLENTVQSVSLVIPAQSVQKIEIPAIGQIPVLTPQGITGLRAPPVA